MSGEPTTSTEAREIAQTLVDEGRGYGTWENALARALLAALDENERLEARLVEVERERDDYKKAANYIASREAAAEARLAEVEKERDKCFADRSQYAREAEAAEARVVELEGERDEFAEAMHQASLAVVRRRAATEEKRA